jgi:hypothetical protein
LKATTVIFSNEVCSTFTAMSSRTLLSVLITRVCLQLRLDQTGDRIEELSRRRSEFRESAAQGD